MKTPSVCSTERSNVFLSRFRDGSKEFSSRMEHSVQSFKHRLNNKRYEKQIRGLSLHQQRARGPMVPKNEPSSERIFNHYV
jgi:hypothetical protein